MRYLIMIFLMLGALTSVHAQSGVSGRIVDKDSRAPLEYATVTVLDAADSTFVTASAAGKDARFTIGKLPAGAYVLEFKFGGYTTATVRVTISGGGEPRDLGDVALEKRAAGKPDGRRP